MSMSMRVRGLLVGLLGVVCAVLVLGAGSAFGALSYPFDGSLAPAGGSFGNLEPGSVAVDDSNGDTYVADSASGVVDVFETVSGTQLAGLDGSLTPAGSFGGGQVEVAANNGTGDVYVLDSTDNVVDVFDGAGGYVCQITGSATPSASECNGVAGSATPAGGFNRPGGVAVDQATGDVYVVDANNGVVDVFSAGGAYVPSASISLASIPGGFFAQYTRGIAVSDFNGDVYLSDSGTLVVYVFNAAGGYETTWTGANTPAGSFGTGYLSVAADDATGVVYVTETSHQVTDVLGSGGAYVTQFSQSFHEPMGTAVDQGSGRVYVSDTGPAVVDVFGPAAPLVPIVRTGVANEVHPTSAVFAGSVNPRGVQLTDCRFEYGDETEYEASAAEPYANAQSVPCVPAAGAIPADSSVHAVSAQVTGLRSGAVYHFRLVAGNAGGSDGFANDGSFQTPPRPVIDGASASDLTAGRAVLHAQIDPRGLDFTYHFEYGTSTAYGTSVPVPDMDIGAGTSDVAVSQVIPGPHAPSLQVDTTYHWRVVAQNENGVTAGVDHTFVYTTAGGGLPDNRAYEMVTPPVKNGATIGGVVFSLLPDWSADGSRLIVSNLQCFGDAQSCLARRQAIGSPYVFTRGSGGWKANALSPSVSQFAASTVMNVNADTGGALFAAPTPPQGEDHVYARAFDGALTDLGPVSPPELGAQGPHGGVMLATANLSRVVVEARTAGWPFQASTEESSIVEYAGGGPPAPVGVKGGAGSKESIDACGTALGGETDSTSAFMALSADGSKIFFGTKLCGAVGGNPAVSVSDLYARVDRSETVKLSESECGAGGLPEEVACRAASPADARFEGASVDGSKAFFLSTQQLTDNASEDSNTTDSASAGANGGCVGAVGANGCNLYEYDFSLPAGRRLTAVSAGDSSGGGPRVQGVVAVSGDGSHVYFVARGVLSANVNSAGAVARAGGENLYVFERDAAQAGGVVRFIATLSDAKPQGSWADESLWNSGPEWGNVSPDGRFLVFVSNAPLTRDDTRADGGAAQVFRYDALTGELVRVSIGARGFNDNGNAGVGDARIPGSMGLYQFVGNSGRRSPTMSDDGRRVFFMSPVALAPGAANDVVVAGNEGTLGFAQNVYEWEQEGAGSCPAGRSEGCVFLVSTGQDASAELVAVCAGFSLSAVCLIGTDTSGSNVFFTTSERLVPGDTDSQLDFYDARVCTSGDPCVNAAPTPLPPCSGEECHGAPPGRASSLTGLSAAFSGAGNIVPRPAAPVVRSLTRAQRLAGALRACRRVRSRKARRACEVLAHRRFGVKSRRASNGRGGRS